MGKHDITSTLAIFSDLSKAGTLLQFECSLSSDPNSRTKAMEIIGPMLGPVVQSPMFRVPLDHKNQYAECREDSALGRVFSIANRNQDHIDAMVVIGEEATLSGIQAILAARCDPYHNETDRATRGSKPRLYFLSDTSDNDTVAATIDRLTRRSLSGLERRFATLLILEPNAFECGAAEQSMGLAELLNRRSEERQEISKVSSKPPFVVVSHQQTGLSDRIEDLVTDRFEVDRSLRGPSLLLTPAGLLPMAFLGLNCIKLIEGALSVCESFALAPEDHSITTQAILLAWLRQPHRQRRVVVHREALQPLARWMTSLENRETDPVIVLPRDRKLLDELLDPSANPNHPPIPWVHHVDAHGHRHDTVVLSNGEPWQQRSPEALANETSRLTLPAIDIESLGKLVQNGLIASALHGGNRNPSE